MKKIYAGALCGLTVMAGMNAVAQIEVEPQVLDRSVEAEIMEPDIRQPQEAMLADEYQSAVTVLEKAIDASPVPQENAKRVWTISVDKIDSIEATSSLVAFRIEPSVDYFFAFCERGTDTPEKINAAHDIRYQLLQTAFAGQFPVELKGVMVYREQRVNGEVRTVTDYFCVDRITIKQF